MHGKSEAEATTDAGLRPIAALYRDLASPHRLQMLRDLASAPRTASFLAQRCELSLQEAMRHLARLQALQLVERDERRAYSLTRLGHLAFGELDCVKGLMRNADFIVSHDLSFIPPFLRHAPLTSSVPERRLESENLLEEARLLGGARIEAFHITGQTVSMVQLAADEAHGRQLAEWNGIYTPEAVLSEPFLPFAAKLATRAERGGRVRLSLARDLPFGLAATEDTGVVFTRHRSGVMDFGTMIRFTAPASRAWARALASHIQAGASLAFDSALGHEPGRLVDMVRGLAEAATREPRPTPMPSAR